MKLPIYMDYHSTTPVDERVLKAMLPFFAQDFGNPASASHSFGLKIQKRIEEARQHVADLIGAENPKEIIFTSGATEANNLAIKGIAETYADKGKHIITQVTEHKSVLDPCKYLEGKGFKVTYLPVDSSGQIRLEDLEKAITDETILISIMFANNEIGTVQPIEAIGKIAKKSGIFFHCDAAQAVGKIPVNVQKMGIDLLAFSGHKMYGPKGVGALYIRSKNPHVRLTPLIHGGGQEFSLRSGTLNVPGIVGLGEACKIAQKEMEKESKRIAGLRDRLYKGIVSKLPDTVLNGHPTERLPNNLHLSFPHIEGEPFFKEISKDMAVSAGSACISAAGEASHVLKYMGLRADLMQSSVRFGLGRFTTQEEVDYAIERVVALVLKLREASPFGYNSN